jgi:hypothetical protein
VVRKDGVVEPFFGDIAPAIEWLRSIASRPSTSVEDLRLSILANIETIDRFYESHSGPTLGKTKPAIGHSRYLQARLRDACMEASALDDATLSRALSGLATANSVPGAAADPTTRARHAPARRLAKVALRIWRTRAFKWIGATVIAGIVCPLIVWGIITCATDCRARRQAELASRPIIVVEPLEGNPYFVVNRDSMTAGVEISLRNAGRGPASECLVSVIVDSAPGTSFKRWPQAFVEPSLASSFLNAGSTCHTSELTIRWNTRVPAIGDTVYMHTAVQYKAPDSPKAYRSETVDPLVVVGFSESEIGRPAVRGRPLTRTTHKH